jgi:hypothetical protein
MFDPLSLLIAVLMVSGAMILKGVFGLHRSSRKRQFFSVPVCGCHRAPAKFLGPGETSRSKSQ